MSWNNPPLYVYHGTDSTSALSIQSGINLQKSRPPLDFSFGFYTMLDPDKAAIWAKKRVARLRVTTIGVQALKPVVIRFVIDRDRLASLDMISFVLPLDDYWSLIKYCFSHKEYEDFKQHGHGRNSTQKRHYDIIHAIMGIPNGDESEPNQPNQRIFDGYDQLSFHSEAAIDLLKLVDVIPVK